ncbi:MAG TPA: hypothetical protein PLC55_17485 [Zoogloea sp.]|nr:hypothetical protein [Zoogloea sp.]
MTNNSLDDFSDEYLYELLRQAEPGGKRDEILKEMNSRGLATTQASLAETSASPPSQATRSGHLLLKLIALPVASLLLGYFVGGALGNTMGSTGIIGLVVAFGYWVVVSKKA